MTETLETAEARFARGLNCAQSVLASFSERYGIPSDLAVQLSAPFGAGIARRGHVCGALTGALMVLGLHHALGEPQDKEQMYEIAGDFIRRFSQLNGSVLCAEILGRDISTPEGLQAARDQNLFKTLCPHVVENTSQALAEHLAAETSG